MVACLQECKYSEDYSRASSLRSLRELKQHSVLSLAITTLVTT